MRVYQLKELMSECYFDYRDNDIQNIFNIMMINSLIIKEIWEDEEDVIRNYLSHFSWIKIGNKVYPRMHKINSNNCGFTRLICGNTASSFPLTVEDLS